MRALSTLELINISGGTDYVPPANPEKEPLRSGITMMGGYVNHYINSIFGYDLTGDTLSGNKILGFSLVATTMLAFTIGLIKLAPPPHY